MVYFYKEKNDYRVLPGNLRSPYLSSMHWNWDYLLPQFLFRGVEGLGDSWTPNHW